MGTLFALIALISWGIGDFLIQRSARKFGDVIALFVITAFGTIALFPFVAGQLAELISQNNTSIFWMLTGTTAVILFAALFDFEALRVGKISVVEPIYAFEVVVTAILASLILREQPTAWQGFLISCVFVGIFLISTKKLSHLSKLRFERGVAYALLATIAMGATNFLFGLSGRLSSPLMVNWFTNFGMTIVLFFYLLRNRQLKTLAKDLRRHSGLIFIMSLFDNMAWVAFTYSAFTIPVSIATGISECYIALAVFLGLVFNREKLRFHQYLGLAACIVAAIALSLSSA